MPLAMRNQPPSPLHTQVNHQNRDTKRPSESGRRKTIRILTQKDHQNPDTGRSESGPKKTIRIRTQEESPPEDEDEGEIKAH
jgi:hypothetical protein